MKSLTDADREIAIAQCTAHAVDRELSIELRQGWDHMRCGLINGRSPAQVLKMEIERGLTRSAA